MKIALVGPEFEENLALRYIHAAATAAGHEAEIFDFRAADEVPAVAAEIAATAPDVVALSMVFTARAAEFIALAERLRQIGYDGHVTAGGHFASFHAARLLSEHPAFDTVVHGEGEEALVELLGSLDDPRHVATPAGRSPSPAPGPTRPTWTAASGRPARRSSTGTSGSRSPTCSPGGAATAIAASARSTPGTASTAANDSASAPSPRSPPKWPTCTTGEACGSSTSTTTFSSRRPDRPRWNGSAN